MGKSKFWEHNSALVNVSRGVFLASNQGGDSEDGTEDRATQLNLVTNIFGTIVVHGWSRETHGLFWKYISGLCFCFKRAECWLLMAFWLSILQGPERASFFFFFLFLLTFLFSWAFYWAPTTAIGFFC